MVFREIQAVQGDAYIFWVEQKLRGNLQKKKQYIQRHRPNRREGGQQNFKKLKRDDFLKVGEGGGHKTYCQK